MKIDKILIEKLRNEGYSITENDAGVICIKYGVEYIPDIKKYQLWCKSFWMEK